tara:strand:- start:12984 stop:13190 length:207 start_codon:yes stop_codon:yes gene_type:complete
MDYATFELIYEGMHRILAKNMLRSFTVADYPYIKEAKAKRKLHRNVYEVGYPENFVKKIIKTTDLELF